MSSKAWWKDKLMTTRIRSVFWHSKLLDIAVVEVKVEADLRKVIHNVIRMVWLWSRTQCNMHLNVFKFRKVFAGVKIYNAIWIFGSKV